MKEEIVIETGQASFRKEASFFVFLWRLIKSWFRGDALVLMKAPLSVKCPHCDVEVFSITKN